MNIGEILIWESSNLLLLIPVRLVSQPSLARFFSLRLKFGGLRRSGYANCDICRRAFGGGNRGRHCQR
jgi:hypothetical protein